MVRAAVNPFQAARASLVRACAPHARRPSHANANPPIRQSAPNRPTLSGRAGHLPCKATRPAGRRRRRRLRCATRDEVAHSTTPRRVPSPVSRARCRRRDRRRRGMDVRATGVGGCLSACSDGRVGAQAGRDAGAGDSIGEQWSRRGRRTGLWSVICSLGGEPSP